MVKYSVTWWRFRALEVAVGLAVTAAAFSLISNIDDQRRISVAPGAWFQVNDIFVPDMRAGEDPVMVYDRTIKEEFRGFWVTEVQRRDAGGSFVLECTGSGINDYEPQDYIPNNAVRYSWYIGAKCADLPPGQYRLRSSWIMRRPGWPDKNLVAYSNLFTVR
jgi:hypothetical protein